MEQDIRDTQEKILEQLQLLNEKAAKQGSTKAIFYTGLIYGFGFFIGSAILATIALGTLGPWIGQIEWVREYYEQGTSIKQASVQAIELK
jgi:hypothetical protein